MNGISRRKVVQGLASAAAVGALSFAAPSASAASCPQATLKVLVLNAWYGGKKIPGGVQMIADIIKESGASLIFIPEAKETTPEIVSKLKDTGLPFQHAMTGDTAIISAYPIGETTTFPFLTKAVVTVGKTEIAAYAAHLEYRWYATYLPRGYGAGVPDGEFSEYAWDKIPSGPVTDVAAVKRVNDASGRPAAIAEFISDARKERRLGRLVVMGGDFNEPSTLDWTKRTARLFDHHGVTLRWGSTQALKDAGFVDAYRLRHPDPASHPGFTWPASNPNAEISELTWTPEADERDRIDYVFHYPDPRLRLTSAEVVGPKGSIVRNQRVDESGRDPIILTDIPWPTDHKGVLASYLVKS
ncbi:endonuclease/exonuclease/phosphatase family protein [Psychromicrobium lacuslunae]|uniref:Endonuclease n=1 Tax=Psychromicrobium lacuslunae TaxID=1618207 RepID=A0A0D4C069_9MICC|nr:endonuclease/exonuclease/phosphatase family protein [Psychromicrobium lacuslunae]AJT42052.1 endonuclease [Psychromicrobium lacuslunae]